MHDRWGHYETLLGPEAMSQRFPYLRELLLVEYFSYLVQWDEQCRQSTGFAACIEAASTPIAQHSNRVKDLLQRFHSAWAEGSQGDRKVWFKKYKFSSAGWRIIRTLSRMPLYLTLIHEGEDGFEGRTDGFLEVAGVAAHQPGQQDGALPADLWERKHASIMGWNDVDDAKKPTPPSPIEDGTCSLESGMGGLSVV